MYKTGTTLASSIHKSIDTLYLQGIKEGINMIKNIAKKHKESDDMDFIIRSANRAIHDLDALINKEETAIPEEVKNAGMSEEAFKSLMEYIDEDAIEIEE